MPPAGVAAGKRIGIRSTTAQQGGFQAQATFPTCVLPGDSFFKSLITILILAAGFVKQLPAGDQGESQRYSRHAAARPIY